MADQKNNFTLIYNLAGFGLAAVLVGYTLSTLMEDTSTPPCSRRYQSSRQFALEGASGGPLSAIELQAHAGARERNVLENVAVIDAPSGPARHALEVTLARAGPYRDSPSTLGGATLTWSPAGIGEAQSACLSYDVEMPANFPFERAGMLPGIYGGEPLPAYRQPHESIVTGFASRLTWHEDGLAGGLGRVPVDEGLRAFDMSGFAFPRGRWVRVEQEVVFNRTGAEDGAYRVWIDGTLRSENLHMTWRKDDSIQMGGLIADVGYDSHPPALAAGQRVTLRFAGIEMAWH